MGYCCVIGCYNSFKKGFLMKKFPSDPERRKIWATKVNRENWVPNNGTLLCEAHFTPDMFEQNRADGKRMLRWNAIPTIFPQNPQKKSKKPQRKRSPQMETREIKEESSDPTLDMCSTIPSSKEDITICSKSSAYNVPPSTLYPRCRKQDLVPTGPKRKKVFARKAKRVNGKPTDASHLCPIKRFSEKGICDELKKEQSGPTLDMCSIVPISKEDIPTYSNLSTVRHCVNRQNLCLSYPKQRKVYAAKAKREREKPTDTSCLHPTKKSTGNKTIEELKKEQSDSTLDRSSILPSSKEDIPTCSISSKSNVHVSTLLPRLNGQDLFPSNSKRRRIFVAKAKRLNGKPSDASLCPTKKCPEKEINNEFKKDQSDPIPDICSVPSSKEDIPTSSNSCTSNEPPSTLSPHLNRQDLVPSNVKQGKIIKRKNGKPTETSRLCPTKTSPKKETIELQNQHSDDATLDICSTVQNSKEDTPTCSISSRWNVPSSDLCTTLNRQDLFLSYSKQRNVPTVIVKIENWKPTDASKLCEAHFIPEMFEKNRTDGKRVLTWDAFTTIFSHIVQKKPLKPPTTRFSEIVTCELKEQELEPAPDMCSTVSSSKEGIPACSTSSASNIPSSTVPPCGKRQNLSLSNLKGRKVFAAKAKRVNGKPTDTSSLCQTKSSPEKETCEELKKELSEPTLNISSTVSISKKDIPACSSSSTSNIPSSPLNSFLNRKDFVPSDVEQRKTCTAKIENRKPTDASHICPTRRSIEKEISGELKKDLSNPTFDMCPTVSNLKKDISTSSSSSTSNVPSSVVRPCINRQDLINRIKLYQKAYCKVVKQNNILKAKLRKMRLSIKKLEENDFLKSLKKIFNDTQIKALCKNTVKAKPKWDNETIKKALKIKITCGKKGYEELINQNFPLPSLRTLRRKVQKVNCHPPN